MEGLVSQVSTVPSTPCHLFYVDDFLLFFRATKRSLDCIKSLLRRYELLAGQHIISKRAIYSLGNAALEELGWSQTWLLSLWPISLLCTWASLFFLVLQDIATSLSSWTLCGPSFLVGSPSPSPLQAGWLWWNMFWLPFQFTHLSLFQSQRKLALLWKSWWETFCVGRCK